ncbi:hypothetical protein BDY21DRAFT_339221 [Lineolata rhizophorae]|uniref:Uncharacterized protein n=1 Tax=Lineolata rhizophorae TaxID=578093 RepID=A0A6A6P639_9PEZI|nr:hypothetical protein BDY21DRAFT_339221 [Lineolata rhizophorae]
MAALSIKKKKRPFPPAPSHISLSLFPQKEGRKENECRGTTFLSLPVCLPPGLSRFSHFASFSFFLGPSRPCASYVCMLVEAPSCSVSRRAALGLGLGPLDDCRDSAARASRGSARQTGVAAWRRCVPRPFHKTQRRCRPARGRRGSRPRWLAWKISLRRLPFRFYFPPYPPVSPH